MSKDFYRRNLPHYQPEGATFFVTIRLNGSLPREVIERLQEEQSDLEQYYAGIAADTQRKERFYHLRDDYFAKFEDLLDGSSTGPHWLREPDAAEVVSEALHYRDGKEYDLVCFCIMPNHVHAIFTPLPATEEASVGRRVSSPYIVTRILEHLKWYTALKCNKLLRRTGPFWPHESYDHVIRTGEELERMIRYVLYNPVKAGLVGAWENWPWTYCKPGLL